MRLRIKIFQDIFTTIEYILAIAHTHTVVVHGFMVKAGGHTVKVINNLLISNTILRDHKKY